MVPSMPGKLLLLRELFGGVFCGELVMICGVLNFMLRVSNFPGIPQKCRITDYQNFQQELFPQLVKLTKKATRKYSLLLLTKRKTKQNVEFLPEGVNELL